MKTLGKLVGFSLIVRAIFGIIMFVIALASGADLEGAGYAFMMVLLYAALGRGLLWICRDKEKLTENDVPTSENED